MPSCRQEFRDQNMLKVIIPDLKFKSGTLGQSFKISILTRQQEKKADLGIHAKVDQTLWSCIWIENKSQSLPWFGI